LRFRTAPPPGGSFRAAVVGDSGISNAAQRAVASLVEELGADILLHTGDLFYIEDADLGLFSAYRRVLSRTALFPCRGNHDLERDEPVWGDLFTLPGNAHERRRLYYSYDWGSAHFTVLDFYHAPANDSAQIEFLIDDLEDARARGVRWLIVYLHLPIYSGGRYGNLRHSFRVEFPDIADRFEVDLVFSGHDHNYQRTHPVRDDVVRDAWHGSRFVRPRGTIYVVTGGGGASLYQRSSFAHQGHYIREFQAVHHAIELDISPDEIRTRAIDLDGTVIDEFSIAKTGARPPLEFLRGDVNGDGRVDVTDVIAALNYLFVGGDSIVCAQAAVASSPGAVLHVTEPIYVLQFLFGGGPPPATPYPTCGPVDDVDAAWCLESGC